MADEPKNSLTFYADLPVLDDFNDTLDADNYHAVPRDWSIVVTDVVNSTGAIEQGKYKEVNTAGCIAAMAIANIRKGMDFPFLFDGDGMKYLVPNDMRAAVEEILLDTRRTVKDAFDLDLRVGLVSLSDVIAAGHSLGLARFRVSSRYVQAMVSGTGLEYAESLVKSGENNRYILPEDRIPTIKADFSGYTCRWQDIHSSKGETISLIIKARAEPHADRCMRTTFEQVQATLGSEEGYHPLTEKNLTLARSGDRIDTEASVLARKKEGLLHALFALSIKIQVRLLGFIVRHSISFSRSGKNLRDVKKDNVLSSDFRKHDGTLKMVASCTPRNRKALQALLDDLHRQKKIFYGLHVSDRALLTCLIHYGSQNEVHFVDAADGGYAVAAKQLKTLIAEASSTQGI